MHIRVFIHICLALDGTAGGLAAGPPSLAADLQP